MKNKFYSYLVLPILITGFINSSIAYAATPALSLAPSGSDIQVSVTGGDSNASVFFYYNINSPSGKSITTIGTTDSNGSFSAKISPSLYGVDSGSSIYVIVNGQQSATQTWSSATVTSIVPTTAASTPVSTPAVITPTSNSNTDLLATIQNIQSQLVQILSQIQIMATKLNQLASSIMPTTPTIISTNSKYQFLNPLTIGDTGTDVSELQKKLKAEGVYLGPINGNFGSLTQEAVKKYQISHGLSPLGNIGPATRAALNL